MKAKARLIALEQARDARCETCWDAMVHAMADVYVTLLHQGVPEEIAWRYFMQSPPLTAAEQAVMDSALVHVQDKVAVADGLIQQFDAMGPRCENWLERRADIGAETRRVWFSRTWPDGEGVTPSGPIAPAP